MICQSCSTQHRKKIEKQISLINYCPIQNMCYKHILAARKLKTKQNKTFNFCTVLGRLTDQQCISYCTEVGQLLRVDGVNPIVVPLTSTGGRCLSNSTVSDWCLLSQRIHVFFCFFFNEVSIERSDQTIMFINNMLGIHCIFKLMHNKTFFLKCTNEQNGTTSFLVIVDV